MTAVVRTLVLWCPDWPTVAAGCLPEAPAAVVAANRVVAATAAARADGVRPGQRRREAQGHCPAMTVLAADPARDARRFEPVVAALEDFTPRIEIIRPGLAGFATRGPSRYFGGDEELARRVLAAVDAVLGVAGPGTGAGAGDDDGDGDGAVTGWVGCRVGVADGRFAAGLAARIAPRSLPGSSRSRVCGSSPASGGSRWTVVAPGRSREHLAPLPVTTLVTASVDRDFTELLLRLGLATLGDLAALPASSVLGRFGAAGEVAHRLSCGLDDRPLLPRARASDLAVSVELDPPAERVDVAAFAARSLAVELHGRLDSRGLSCARVAVEAETGHGERLLRLWRHEGALGPETIAERVRWQLDAWLGRGGITGGLTLIRLVPDEVGPAGGRQLDFWGGAEDCRGASRVLARLQGLLGSRGVVVPVLEGGRSPRDEVRMVPWGEPRGVGRPGGSPEPLGVAVGELVGPPPTPGEFVEVAEQVPTGGGVGSDRSTGLAGSVERHPASVARRAMRSLAAEEPPWPGRLPGPAPAGVLGEPCPVSLRDADGSEPAVSGRGALSSPPVELAIGGRGWEEVEAWSGPWPLEERWWEGGRRRARLQVVAGGVAYLLVREGGRWWAEAIYD